MKNAVIVGASGGIGRALSEALKQKGYHLVEASRTSPYFCDLTDLSSIHNLTSRIKNEISSLDLLINAAGIPAYQNLVDTKDEEIISTFQINVISLLIIIRDLLPIMQHKNSLVLSLGSGAGTIPMRGRSIYCATKFALRGLHLSLSEEYEGKNPAFCHITLGSTLTSFGNMTIEEKTKEKEKGKAYFPVEFVVDKLIQQIEEAVHPPELVLFPGDYGFGTWHKP